MKILWLSHLVPYPPKGGVLQRAYYLFRELSRYHEVDLIAFNQKGLIESRYRSQEEGLSAAREVLSKHGKHIEFLPIESDKTCFGRYLLATKSLFTSDPYSINWLKSSIYAAAVQKRITEVKYDLIHFDTISLIPYFDLVGNLPSVLDHHNVESHMLMRRAENETNWIRKWYFSQEGERLKAIENRICPRVTLNITCSDIDKKRLEYIAPGSRVEEVPNGVDTDYFSPDWDVVQSRSLLFIGSLSWYPNIEAVRFIAFELFPVLKKELLDVKIHIIGSNPPDDIVKHGEIENDFYVHGFVNDIRSFMNEAAIYICPIRDGGGTKLKILDALAMGKALVSHPIACEGINVMEGENVIFAKTVDEYVQAIAQLLSDDRLRENMGRKARQLIEMNYTYEEIGKRLSGLYEGIAAAHHEAQADRDG